MVAKKYKLTLARRAQNQISNSPGTSPTYWYATRTQYTLPLNEPEPPQATTGKHRGEQVDSAEVHHRTLSFLDLAGQVCHFFWSCPRLRRNFLLAPHFKRKSLDMVPGLKKSLTFIRMALTRDDKDGSVEAGSSIRHYVNKTKQMAVVSKLLHLVLLLFIIIIFHRTWSPGTSESLYDWETFQGETRQTLPLMPKIARRIVMTPV